MKIKQQVVITDPAAFARNDFDWCFTLYGVDINLSDREILATYDRDIDELQALIQRARGES